MTCKNCSALLLKEYQFCPLCGETAYPHRLTLKHIMHEFIHAVVHADKGIFLLVKELAYHPGRVALEYAEGVRKKYFNPVSFLLIMGGLAFFLRYKMGVIQSINDTKLSKYISEFVHQYTTPIIILTIPLLSFYSWLFFKAAGKNYAENMVMNMYMIGEYHLFSIAVFIFPAWLFPQFNILFVTASFLMMAIYYFFTCKRFFQQSTTVTVIKVIVIELLFLMTLVLFIGIGLFLQLAVFSGLHIRDLR